MPSIKINKHDVIWTYAATFMKVGVGVILLPFILHTFPSDLVGIWTVFTTIITLANLFDLGFTPTFTRSMVSVYSGAKQIQKNGIHNIEDGDTSIDFSLFKGLISAMKYFYSRIGIILLTVLLTIGTFYIYRILQDYSGNKTEIYIAWFILCIINSYNCYAQFYDALLKGVGKVKRINQIKVLSSFLYILVAIVLILLKFNLIAIVCAQVVQVLSLRLLSHKSFFTKKLKTRLLNVVAKPVKEVIKPIAPNAIKLGIVGFATFLTTRVANILAPLYLPLSDVASYGITIQIIIIIGSLTQVYFFAYEPQIINFRVTGNLAGIKKLFWRCSLIMVVIFVVFGAMLVFLGDWALGLIHSKTFLTGTAFTVVALLMYMLEMNWSNAGGFILSNNEVPFFYADIITGVSTVVIMFLLLQFTNLGIWSLLIAQFATGLANNYWKWTLYLLKQLKK
jgi:O-antigen/teichoic acid export membrane protein